jgi:2-isopropylmalate synthase
MAVDDLLHSWDDVSPAHLAAVQIEDDTLRDGLQGAYLRQPCQADKIDTLRRSAALGVRYHMLGFPASSPREFEDCRALLRVIKEERMAVVPRFLARARREDIECIARLNDEFALEVWADFFVATSPLRRAIEGWELADVVAKVQTAGHYAASRGCPFGVSLEDSSRTRGADLAAVIAVAAEVGAGYLTLCDTAGALSPTGARKLTRFVREHLAMLGRPLALTWHGHNDRGLGLANALAAAEEGVDVISGAFLGIGERSGNTALEQVIIYLWQNGHPGFRVEALVSHCQRVAACVGKSIDACAPLIGDQAFATGTGTHAAAILKGRALGIEYEDLVFSAVPAHKLGRGQEVTIGPLSGLASARYMLTRLAIDPTEDNAARLLEHAKRTDRALDPEQIRGLFATGSYPRMVAEI